MKKLVFAVLGISLFLPALAGAAPAQTRWDMTIAGQIGIWAAWSDQNSAQIWNPGSTAARRTGTDENRTDEIGNLAAHVDPRLVFVIKGPQVWGAKSTARFEFDFFGAYPNTNGTARAKSTYINLEWPKDSILFGNGTSPFKNTNVGLPPGVAESVALPDAFGGTRAVQLMWEHRFGKGWTSQFALTHPNQEGFRHSTPAVPNPSIYSESNCP
ncbi:MAG TPA: hypothetical protein VHO84_16390, partial [Syntrophorhabdaceae bacterium]|nr:hypothetical protein [Syntrophorhabdaceae bacterium]